MRIPRVILIYLLTSLIVTINLPTVSFPYSTTPFNDSVAQYILDLSRDIYNSIDEPDQTMLYDSSGEVRLSLYLSPWGELKDIHVSNSSGNRELDELCINAAKKYKRYQPFPELLGDGDRWIDVPIVFYLSSDLGAPKDRFVELKIEKEPPEFLLDINEATDIALENSRERVVAEEEIKLSDLKIREARRALYPAASLNYSETTGKTTSVQTYTDKEYKLKFEFPLYYGWRLKYAVQQAMANKKASIQNYDKVIQDLRLEVESSLYLYVAKRMNVELQKALLKEAKEVFDLAKKKFELGLSIKAEFLEVESQIKQITYQVHASETEMELAKFNIEQVMNIQDLEGLDIDLDLVLEPVMIDVSMDECLTLAFRYRPDLKAKEHIVDVNEYERKIALSKNQFKVDLTGTMGRSGGAYETETLEMGEDWYLGLKVSKPLGGNTLSTSYVEDKTSEKHGVSSKTESTTKSVEFGVLDNMKYLSEKKQVEISLVKAEDDLEETKETVFKEVKEAFLNYKKGLIQVKTNLNKILYREEELKIIKARSELGEVAYSELIRSLMQLTDEKSFYIESLGSLYQNLVKLNKATGFSLLVDDEEFSVARAR